MVITKFKLYESMQWNKEYILCIPSGEVIYYSGVEIEPLASVGYIHYYNKGLDEYPIYMCNDYLVYKVKKYINDRQETTNSPKKKEISDFLIDCGLLKDQFKINDDFSIDAFGPVNMSYRDLDRIPFKFNRCTSDFTCSHNNLVNLDNAPYSVHGNFDCSYNKLNDLKNGPKLVSKNYNCSHNHLMTLLGSPLKLKYFNCSYNFLSDLDHAPVVANGFIKNDNLFQ